MSEMTCVCVSHGCGRVGHRVRVGEAARWCGQLPAGKLLGYSAALPAASPGQPVHSSPASIPPRPFPVPTRLPLPALPSHSPPRHPPHHALNPLQEKNASEPELTPELAAARDSTVSLALQAGLVQQQAGLQLTPEEVATSTLKFGLAEVGWNQEGLMKGLVVVVCVLRGGG